MFYTIRVKCLLATFDYNSDGLEGNELGSQLHEPEGNGEEARDVKNLEALV